MLDIVASYPCMQFHGKLMNQTWENGKKLVLAPISAHLAQIPILAPSVASYYSQLSSCTISEKTNDPVLRKLSDWWTDGQTDRRTEGQTDKSDFIGSCPTNVECPIIKKWQQLPKTNLAICNIP